MGKQGEEILTLGSEVCIATEKWARSSESKITQEGWAGVGDLLKTCSANSPAFAGRKAVDLHKGTAGHLACWVYSMVGVGHLGVAR